jgi:hypothetical protein
VTYFARSQDFDDLMFDDDDILLLVAKQLAGPVYRHTRVGPKKKAISLGGSDRRQDGGTLSRFEGVKAHGSRISAALPADHAALSENRTIFPKSVVRADLSPWVLVSGHNSSKIGKRVMKGPWRGFPIYTVTLEERATCPSSCTLLRECYGNSMPYARRHQAGSELIAALDAELRQKAKKHPRGFAVRVHVLGDFYSLDYAKQWLRWMVEIPSLHVWGYTAHSMWSEIGRWIDAGNDEWPDRWAFRFSVGEAEADRGYTATTIWRKPGESIVAEGQVCPMQQGKTQACALCWAPAAAATRIVFIGHGMGTRKAA